MREDKQTVEQEQADAQERADLRASLVSGIEKLETLVNDTVSFGMTSERLTTVVGGLRTGIAAFAELSPPSGDLVRMKGSLTKAFGRLKHHIDNVLSDDAKNAEPLGNAVSVLGQTATTLGSLQRQIRDTVKVEKETELYSRRPL